jgi:hypothetical protein
VGYILLPTKVSVTFYSASGWQGKFIGFFTRSKIHHCGLMLDRDDKSVIMIASKKRSAKFVDSKSFHKIKKPLHVVDVGEFDVSINQLSDYLYKVGKNTLVGLMFWCLIGRWICQGNIPASCTLYVCQLLRLCGYKIRDIIIPKELYRELADAVDNDIGKSRSR